MDQQLPSNWKGGRSKFKKEEQKKPKETEMAIVLLQSHFSFILKKVEGEG